MSINNYKVTHSNYTLKKIHQIVKGGTIYERDYMTLLPQGRSSDETFTYNEGNFKMVSRRDNNGKRKHYFGDWIENPCATTSADTYYWNLACLSGVTQATEDRIFLKPNYNDILDFAYFGSLVSVVENTIKEIVNDFPGELLPTDTVLTYTDANGEEQPFIYGLPNTNTFATWKNGSTLVLTDGENIQTGNDAYSSTNKSYLGRYSIVEGSSGNQITIEGSDKRYTKVSTNNTQEMYYVENPFEIDAIHETLQRNTPANYNILKLLSSSYGQYAVAKTLDNGECTYSAITSWSVTHAEKPCNDGDWVGTVTLNGQTTIQLQAFLLNGEVLLFGNSSLYENNISIRPYDWENKRELKYTFYDDMSDFARLLLNKRDESFYNEPYTCFIETPQETDTGLKTNKVAYTWPTATNNYNLDVTTERFRDYVNSLLDIAEFYDDGFSNNLWNRMTHDSIKNLDRTFTKTNSTDTDEDYAIGTSKIESIVQIAASMFDELKRSIDNIGSTNIITYNQNNNIPDYFLSDTLQLSGWEVSNALQGLRKQDLQEKDKQTNVDFMRNLKLNSKSIFSKKGTRMAIEELLGLFGLKSYDMAAAEYNSLPQSIKAFSSPTYSAFLYSSTSAVTVNNVEYRYRELQDGTKTLPQNTVITVLGGEAVIFYGVQESGNNRYTAQSATTYTVNSSEEVIWIAQSEYATSAPMDQRIKIGTTDYYAAVVGLDSGYTIRLDPNSSFGLCWYDGSHWTQIVGKTYTSTANGTLVGIYAPFSSTAVYTITDPSGETSLTVYYKLNGTTFDSQPSASSLYDYTIDEYVEVANNTISGETVDQVIEYNNMKFVGDALDSNNALYGLPCVMVEKGETKYIVPWFTNLTELDGRPYFQMYGGWGKMKDKKLDGMYRGTHIPSGSTLSGYTYTFYDESVNYVGVVNSLNDLTEIPMNKLHDGDVYYVYDIDAFESYYPEEYGEQRELNLNLQLPSAVTTGCYYNIIPLVSGESIEVIDSRMDLISLYEVVGNEFTLLQDNATYTCRKPSINLAITKKAPFAVKVTYMYYNEQDKPSHYFYLPNKENRNFYGEYEEGTYGWINVHENGLNNNNALGIRVLYLESIIDSSIGNNPHVGYGQYDSGEEFLDYFRQIFKGAIENDLFSSDAYQCASGDLLSGITNTGFSLTEYVDNMKTWYFSDYSTGIQQLTLSGNTYVPSADIQPNVGATNTDKSFSSTLTPNNFEVSGEEQNNKEMASLSVINTKKIVINFNGDYPTSNEGAFKNYFYASILPYLRQVLPSTAIVQYDFSQVD